MDHCGQKITVDAARPKFKLGSMGNHAKRLPGHSRPSEDENPTLRMEWCGSNHLRTNNILTPKDEESVARSCWAPR
ncbi:hypothetical protein GWK47_022761 [Chionoecetes opilio]|uniref:Uncharacterized protein n=1 Tax=Chionoecetes opilio TaxID=41210 RepID=A0A8J5CDJ4_CHIOP|nr:hypothetical protein GWK47_022761 [Chionoecetes opilio]